MKKTALRSLSAGLIAGTAVIALAACSSSDPLAAGTTEPDASGSTSTISIGSAGFAESEIIGELYAQALEAKGVTVSRTFQIGQRDAYIAALEDGSIDLVPEYSGNLLQFFDAESTAKSSDEVFAALSEALPEGFEVLDQAKAEDKDSYNVTAEFSQEHGVTSLADLADAGVDLVVGGNPELAERPYGPEGLTSVYGVPAGSIEFVPISDSGGPLTVKALLDGDVNIADIYSTTPAIAENGFVTLEDPENLILPQNVLPLINSSKVTPEISEVLNAVSAQLTTEDLIALNTRNSGDEKASPAVVAKDWLTEKGLI